MKGLRRYNDVQRRDARRKLGGFRAIRVCVNPGLGSVTPTRYASAVFVTSPTHSQKLASSSEPSPRFPAEWETHDACWVAWPSHPAEWPQHLEPAREEFLAMCRSIGESERLEILVLDGASEQRIARELPGTRVRFHGIRFGDIWTRDTGPIFLDDRGELSAVCFRWNGWGGKYLFADDPDVGAAIARVAGARSRSVAWVLEGGGIEVDGAGTALTTRQCLLDANRNDGDEKTAERILAEHLGIERVIWIDRGLLNDHTDGHIDTLARFVAPGRVVCMAASAGDPNREVLDEIRSTLRGATDAAGRRLDVVEVPSPGRIDDASGAPMPASYMNFYIANGAVVVPAYGSNADAAAVDALGALFPGRPAVGLSARAILTGGGAFHCITKQQPRPAPRQRVSDGVDR
jgi:agmatine deiminase